MLTIFISLLVLYEKYGAIFTFKAFLFILVLLLLIVKLFRIQNQELQELKDKTVSYIQKISIKSILGYVKTGDLNQNMGTNPEKENKEGKK
jgi:putative copper export protein